MGMMWYIIVVLICISLIIFLVILTIFYLFILFLLRMTCGILVPQPDIEPISPPWEGGVLTTWPLAKSLFWPFLNVATRKFQNWNAYLALYSYATHCASRPPPPQQPAWRALGTVRGCGRLVMSLLPLLPKKMGCREGSTELLRGP